MLVKSLPLATAHLVHFDTANGLANNLPKYIIMRLSNSLLYASFAASGLASGPSGQSERSLERRQAYPPVAPIIVGQAAQPKPRQNTVQEKPTLQLRPPEEPGIDYLCFDYNKCKKCDPTGRQGGQFDDEVADKVH